MVLVSAVGRDVLGEQLLDRLREWGLDLQGVEQRADLPTGTVIADFSNPAEARYTLTTDVAWDRISVSEPLAVTAATAQAAIFGSLALRSPSNRAALEHILAALPAGAWRVFDVNLRPPFDDEKLVRELAPRATLLKLNNHEARRLAGRASAAQSTPERDARALESAFGCQIICVTCGSDGAGLLKDGNWLWEDARPVEIVDTVGCGDAFLATLLNQLLEKNADPLGALRAACRAGEWVATQAGATPPYPAASAGA